MINDTAKKWIIGLAMPTLILAATLVIGLVHLTNSEMYLGMKYMEIYASFCGCSSVFDTKIARNRTILSETWVMFAIVTYNPEQQTKT